MEYKSLASHGEQFASELTRQLDELLRQQNISLGFPLQSRIKTWNSIAEKIQRRTLQPSSVKDISDLIGLRIVLLFQRDVSAVCGIIKANFKVLETENTREKLPASEFGYSSVHFLIEPPPEWLMIPTLKKLGNFKAEIQVRTVAQHIWASASHILQYKQEQGVPASIRRAIYRVSALLETVDLEFERVLQERATYVSDAPTDNLAEVLNVDLLVKILDELLPQKNKSTTDQYADVLVELAHFSITTNEQLRKLIQDHKTTILKIDKEMVEKAIAKQIPVKAYDKDHVMNGAYFTYVGLTRQALAEEFKDKWKSYSSAKWANKRSKNS